MSDQVLLALIVAIPAVIASSIGPTIVLLINNINANKIKQFDANVRKQEKIDDYKRADELEARRKKETEEVASLLKTNTAIQVSSAGDVKGQLQQIHSLVNSNLTSEMEARLTVMQTSLASLIEIAELRKSLGHPESENTNSQITAMRDKISELLTTLETRREVTEAAAIEKKVTETATKAAVAAITASGPLTVKIEQDETNPVPVKPVVVAHEDEP